MPKHLPSSKKSFLRICIEHTETDPSEIICKPCSFQILMNIHWEICLHIFYYVNLKLYIKHKLKNGKWFTVQSYHYFDQNSFLNTECNIKQNKIMIMISKIITDVAYYKKQSQYLHITQENHEISVIYQLAISWLELCVKTSKILIKHQTTNLIWPVSSPIMEFSILIVVWRKNLVNYNLIIQNMQIFIHWCMKSLTIRVDTSFTYNGFQMHTTEPVVFGKFLVWISARPSTILTAV